jgi:hypothetical protein
MNMTPGWKILAPLGLAAAAASGGLAWSAMQPPAPALQAAAAAPQAARAARIVAAADAFLGSLTEAQRRAAMFPFGDSAQRGRWSNLPPGAYRRAGVRLGELNAAQRAAFADLLAVVLSPQGVQMVKEQLDADDVLRGESGGRGPGFGADNYYVAFLGRPSATAPWMLQFGGHHLALNVTVVGANLTLAPSLTGGQPTRYVKDGKPVYVVAREVAAAQAMLDGLTPAQHAKAVLGDQSIDLVLGAGHDGQALQPEGLPGREMTDAQKARLLALIEARLGMLNADDLAVVMAPIRRSLNDTWFAWYGSPRDAGSAYFRVTGPTLVLEFAPQGFGGPTSGDHIHSIYRDPTNEYGSAWTALR